MAVKASGGGDNAIQRGSGSLVAGTPGDWVELDGPFNLFLAGTWTGPVALECSPDGGTTVYACEYSDQTPITFSTNGQVVASGAVERSMLYRLNRATGTGTTLWRMSR